MCEIKKYENRSVYSSPVVEVFSLELESAVLVASPAGINRLEEENFQW